MTSIALFNNKGGVGKTTLTYHLAHMLQRLGKRVLAVDLDPQSNLTAAFLDENALEALWDEGMWADAGGESSASGTMATAVRPILEGTGDIAVFRPIEIVDGLWLAPGDLSLSSFEDRLSDAWPRGFTGDRAALRVTTAFHRIITHAAREVDADVVLIDVGPNLGAINRAALLAADTVLMPLAADLFSLSGLRNLGPTLQEWRSIWQDTVLPKVPAEIDAPAGRMTPLGYVVMQAPMRLDRPVKAYYRWLERIPAVYSTSVLGHPASGGAVDSHNEIATLRNYQSLMPLAHDARKPMFDLRAADGALGSTQQYVQKCYQEFRQLAITVMARLDEVGRTPG